MSEADSISAVARVLGGDFARLPVDVQTVHSGAAICIAGRADVQRGAGLVKHLICASLGFPRHGPDQRVTIKFSTDAKGADRWERDFDGRRYASFLSAGSGACAGRLVERLGLFTIVFGLTVDDGQLVFRMAGLSVFGIAVPLKLLPDCVACEDGRDGEFTFDIAVSLPFLGRLIRYRGVTRRMG